MKHFLKVLLSRMALCAICAAMLAACATNPNAPPDPGSKKWYQQRMAEIETAKTNGELTEEQFLTLKTQADATRAAHLDAMRRNNYTSFGFGIGSGHIRPGHHH